MRSALAAGGGAPAGSSSSSKGKKAVFKSKAAHKRRHRLQQAQSLLFCWPFVSSCGLWASSLGLHQGHLKPLLFPLVSVAAAAVKLHQQQLACAPFCLGLLEAIAAAGIVADALVPVTAPLLAVLQLLLQQHATICRRSSGSGYAAAGGTAAAAAAKPQKKRKRGSARAAANTAAGPLRLRQVAAAHVETCIKIDSAQQESLNVRGDTLAAAVAVAAAAIVVAAHVIAADSYYIGIPYPCCCCCCCCYCCCCCCCCRLWSL